MFGGATRDRTTGLLKLGKVSLDGTKVKANASKHHADSTEKHEGMNIPQELARRQDRLEAITAAKEKIKQRADERFCREQQKYEQKVVARKEKSDKTGKKPRGPKPKPPTSGPSDKEQVNLTDEESRIMPSSKGFVQAYNAQAGVEPVFGIIKQVMGFRQFHVRGHEAVSGEWLLASIAWNSKRMFALSG